MPISDQQWIAVAPTPFPHEQEAFDFIKQHAQRVVGAWSNFEFMEPGGKVYEVDLMVLTLTELFLIEIKHWSGALEGTVNNLLRYHRGNPTPQPVDNPLFLINKKAKILQSMLREQGRKLQVQVPYVESLVFFSNPQLEIRIPPEERQRLYHGQELFAALLPKERDLQNPHKRLDRSRLTALNKAFRELGIRPPTSRAHKVGEWQIRELLEDGELYQDHLAVHQSMHDTFRRVRTFNLPARGSDKERETARRAAHREFKLTDALQHPGILKPLSFVEHELGPALIFYYHPQSQRLHQYLAGQKAQLTLEQRLDLLRQLADVLRYAHARHVYHRGLAPQCITVTQRDGRTELQVMDWQTGMEADVTAGTSHLGELMTKGARAYMAPEAFHQPSKAAGHLADIFSFGAIAFHVLSGAAAAENQLELYQMLQTYPGLRLSAVTDGLGPRLEELVELCTHPLPAERPQDMLKVLELLDPPNHPDEAPLTLTADPLHAKGGDRLPGDFVVVRRLGKGAMALALEVARQEESFVLKVAHEAQHGEHLAREAQALQSLSHPYIVECLEVLEMAGRTCLLLEKAGEETLARRLARQGPLQLDYLERFGQDLLKALVHLEKTGVRHRDIKPANLGVVLHKKDSTPHLMLFDFSLAGTPDDNIEAGTRDYLDPFLINGKPPRWEPSADRYSAAVTLHEMATGVLPRWGDGSAAPGLDPTARLVLESERFEPALRERMTAFFTRALARERGRRYDNAEDMLQAWSEIFTVEAPAIAQLEIDEERLKAQLLEATPQTNLAALGLGVRPLRALEHLQVYTIADFVKLSTGALHTAAGVGNDTRKRLVELHGQLADLLGQEILEPAEEKEPQTQSLGSLETFRAGVLGPDSHSDHALKESYLGLTLPAGEVGWPTLSEVSSRHRVDPLKLAKKLPTWRVQWGKLSSLKVLRDEIAQLLSENSGLMTTTEVAVGLLSRHGSASNDPDRRMKLAHALTRAAVEAEHTFEASRFQWHRIGMELVITEYDQQRHYLEQLARVADRCALHEPLLSPTRAAEEIRAVPAPEGIPPLPSHRLLRLAALCSNRAAVSSREEFYPRGMEAERALVLAHGALLGHNGLTVEEIRNRVLTRYPLSIPVPERPELDKLLQKVDPDLLWHEGDERYRRREAVLLSSSGTSHHQRYTTTEGTRVPGSEPSSAEALVFEERLRRALKEQDFLVLTVEAHRLADAESELLHRFDLTRQDLSQMLLRSMRTLVEANPKAQWDKFLEADAETNGKGWRVLTSRLVPDALKPLAQDLLGCSRPQLLVNPGLLARYDQLELLETLRDRSGARDGQPAVWLLIPTEDASRPPAIDGKPVPILHGGQKARIPEAWLSNIHRTAREKLAP